jgi:AAA domain/Primase C terminal 1 (PriCT-1)
VSIVLSVGEDHNSALVRRVRLSSMAAVAKRLRRHPSTPEGGSYITPGPMRGNHRKGENAEAARIIGIDFDFLTPEEALAVRKAAARYSAIVYETRSSTPQKPRLRLLIECATEIEHERYEHAHDTALAALRTATGLRLEADRSCAKSEQPLFTPLAGREVELFDGAPLEIPNNPNASTPVDDGRFTPGKRNVNLTRLAGSLRRQGLNEEQIYAQLRLLNSSLSNPLPDREIRAIAKSVSRYPPAGSDAGPAIVLRSAADLVENPTPARWLLRPYLEQDVLGVLSGEYGTFKSFLSLDWALHIAAGRHWHNDRRGELSAMPAVFISAEGRGLAKRVSAWVSHYCTDETREDALKRLKFYAIEMAIDLSNEDRMTALVEAVDALRITPALIVVDTLTKNSSGVEENNSAMQDFLNTINASLRMRYRCSVLLIHHVGHVEKGRPRGPSSLVANTDAAFRVERAGENLVLTTDRLKDSEVPEPLSLRALQVELGQDEEGQSLSSLVLTVDHGFDPRIVPKGANQRALWLALRESGTTSYTKDELTTFAREVGIDRPRVPEAIEGLRKARWLIERGGRFDFSR